MTISELPAEALAAVGRIEAMLEQARGLVQRLPERDETSFALGETERRYLPDTLGAYLDIPPSRRDAAATEMLLGQLELLERATATRLAALSEASRTNLAANGAFLQERFGALESLPDAPALPASEGTAPSRALVARLFAQFEGTAVADPKALLALAAERFSRLLPNITTVRRAPFGGAIRSVAIEVPYENGLLRYALQAARVGLEATCTKIVRGVALRTERVEVGSWLQGLFDDLSAYVERDRASRELLTSFFGG
ncbi:MAG: hypothetical protein ACREM2_03365 [Vulcanimicrobiaceae bacterium]